MKKYALLSVSDKTGIVEFASELVKLGYSILSTGGTAKTLVENKIPCQEVSDLTGFPECLDGRVKTLHPKIHGGILALRDNPSHMEQIRNLGIDTIDIVAVNLYPFRQTILKEDCSFDLAVENIDIGPDAGRRGRFRDGHDAKVDIPTKNNLCRCLAVFFGDGS